MAVDMFSEPNLHKRNRQDVKMITSTLHHVTNQKCLRLSCCVKSKNWMFPRIITKTCPYNITEIFSAIKVENFTGKK